MYILGQIFGVLAAAVCIIEPLFKYKWQMLLSNLLANIFVALNFVFIGQFGTTVVLCSLQAVQVIISMFYLRKGRECSHGQQVLFFFLYLIAGIWGMVTVPGFKFAVNLRNLLELMPICGALMSMAYVFVPDEQKARKCLLLSNLIWLTYMLIMRSMAFLSQLISAISTSSALIHYHRARQSSAKYKENT